MAPRSRSQGPALALAAAAALCLSQWALTFVAPAAQRRTWSFRARPSTAWPRVARPVLGGEQAPVRYDVGDRVRAMSPDDELWYPGTVDADNGDGTFSVKWDDPDGGPETNNLGPSSMKKIIIFKEYVVGDDVRAMPPDDESWYPGVVSKTNKDGTFEVKWDDPDGGDETANVDPEFMRKVVVFRDYKPDDEVEAAYPDDGSMYFAVVVAKNKDGTFKVKWDDPDGGPEESDVSPKDMRYPPIPVDSLEAGQKYMGTVKAIRDFGAFVDIGAAAEGLLHISQVSEDRVDDINNVLEDGQQVEVWVSDVRDDGKFSLTMVEGKSAGGASRRAPVDLGPFVGLNPSDFHDGVVEKIIGIGAIVKVTLADGSEASGLVHISQVKDGYVDRLEDELDVGQEVRVRVESVDEAAGKMRLSMKEAGGGRGPPREKADLTPFESITADQWLDGKVGRIAPFGAFVSVTTPDGESSAVGLVHVTQIKDGFVDSVEAELEVGQEVKARVVSVDVDAGKMSLSLKDEAESFDGEETEPLA
uniref:30S ribosomal protein S1 n=1 Tax=Zooxanthella nutricula TaxID=1333877 RepID=A0A7S2ILP7_9DINO